MSATLPADADVLRPADRSLKGRFASWAMTTLIDPAFAVLRRVWPVARAHGYVVVTRYDDVREVFRDHVAYPVTYGDKLAVIMGGEPFFLGEDDSKVHDAGAGALREVVKAEDIEARLAPAVERVAERIVAAANGRLEVVDRLVRTVTFEVFCEYFGVTAPAQGNLKLWSTRLFEFQFADPGNDPALRREVVETIAPALRAHVDTLIAARKAAGAPFGDDVLGRCLAKQASDPARFSDTVIRSALVGFLVGGVPQPPMLVPQAMEQLLRRPELAGAQAAARAGDDALLASYVFEAMRFDPLAPALMRTVKDVPRTIAIGTKRQTTVPAGSTVLVALRSAMMDPRRIPEPRRFDPHRLPHEYMHFGHGMHECFAVAINRRVLPLMLKPLLRRANLRRAPGIDGHLSKRGAFADRLWVTYDP